MKRCLASLAAALVLAGCFGPSEEEQIQTAVRTRLKDPASAQFGTLTLVAPDRACQTVNARNGFGGYTGDKQAVVTKMKGTWNYISSHEMSHAKCIEIVKDLDLN